MKQGGIKTPQNKQHMRVLDTINPHPTRAVQDGRYRREYSTKTWGASRGQKACRSKRKADALVDEFMRTASKARAYEDRRAKRKRTA